MRDKNSLHADSDVGVEVSWDLSMRSDCIDILLTREAAGVLRAAKVVLRDPRIRGER